MDLVLIWILLVSFGATLVATPPARRIGAALGLLDHPHQRKLQSTAIPRTGGIGILAGIVAGLGVIFVAGGPRGIPLGREIIAICAGGLLIHVVGILDDLWDVPAPVKLFAQAASVGVVVSSGVVLRELSFGSGATWSLGPLAVPVTAFFLLGFVNALNLVDGLDGLASGIAAVGAFSMAVAGVLLGNVVLAALAICLLGAILGFLPFNLRSERKTFLGDAGSMLVGYGLAVTALMGVRFGRGDVTPLVVAVAAASVPILDTATTIVRRSRNGTGLFRPDSMHLHHRLIRFGLTPRRAALTLVGTTLVVSCQTLAYAVDGLAAFLAVSVLALALVAIGIRRARRAPEPESDQTFREIVFYLLGAQDGATPRLRGDLAIVEILSPDGRGAETVVSGRVAEVASRHPRSDGEPQLVAAADSSRPGSDQAPVVGLPTIR